jgi:hypothetical protein
LRTAVAMPEAPAAHMMAAASAARRVH